MHPDPRDHLSRRRTWVGDIGECDTVPNKLGKLISNPLFENGDYDTRQVNGRFEILEEEPSRKSDRRSNENLSFKNVVDQLDIPTTGCTDVKGLMLDWYELACSFVHSDVFAIDLTNQIESERGNHTLRTIILDLFRVLTLVLSSISSRFLIEIGEACEARALEEMRDNRIFGRRVADNVPTP